MEYMYLKARAKINIAIDILKKRDDGYHEMRMIMQTLHLHDELFIKKIVKPVIKISCNLKWLPIDDKNIVYRAADLLIKRFGIKEGVFIEINKSIPISAGLAGGSADCAATLVGMRKIWNLPITNEELLKIGKSIGSDVPFCIQRGTMLAEGIGDQLTRLPPHPKVHVVLAKPSISISTPDIFGHFDGSEVKRHPDIEHLIINIKKGNIEQIAMGFCNVLETVTIKRHPEITLIKETMMNHQALGALMSGTGPTVFAYFQEKEDALKAVETLKNGPLQLREVFLTSIYNPISEKKNS